MFSCLQIQTGRIIKWPQRLWLLTWYVKGVQEHLNISRVLVILAFRILFYNPQDQTGRAQDFMEEILDGLMTPADCQSVNFIVRS